MSMQPPPPPPGPGENWPLAPGGTPTPPQWPTAPQPADPYQPNPYYQNPYQQWQPIPVKQRVDAKLAGGLIVLGAVVTIVAVFLPWATARGASANGMDTYWSNFEYTESPGIVSILAAVVLGAFGIALFFAGRVIALGVLTIIGALGTSVVGIGMIAIVSDAIDTSVASLGVGVILQPIAPLLCLVGGIISLAKTR